MNESFKDKAWLSEMYLGKGLSSGMIAFGCGTSRAEISRWLKKHGIPERERTVINKGRRRRLRVDIRDSRNVPITLDYHQCFEEVTVGHTFSLAGSGVIGEDKYAQCALCGGALRAYFVILRDDGRKFGAGTTCLKRVGLEAPRLGRERRKHDSWRWA